MHMEIKNHNERGDTNTEFEFIKKYLEKDKIKVVNLARRSDLVQAYNTIQKLVGNNEETTIVIEPGKLELGDVSIRITALSITIFELEKLIRAIKKADSVDIYPLTDGMVRLDIQFNDVYSVYITN